MTTNLSKQAINRMQGLVSLINIENFETEAANIISDLESEGFEKEEAIEFLILKLKKI